jgi:hypothetical protein
VALQLEVLTADVRQADQQPSISLVHWEAEAKTPLSRGLVPASRRWQDRSQAQPGSQPGPRSQLQAPASPGMHSGSQGQEGSQLKV